MSLHVEGTVSGLVKNAAEQGKVCVRTYAHQTVTA